MSKKGGTGQLDERRGSRSLKRDDKSIGSPSKQLLYERESSLGGSDKTKGLSRGRSAVSGQHKSLTTRKRKDSIERLPLADRKQKLKK